ncbi:MAG: hypothetical protein AAF525_15150, partial [Pseudomonadota bacterium]
MKFIFWLIGVVVAIPVLIFGSIYAASELGGEVVILERMEQTGEVSQIRVWIVDDGESAYIEHGDPGAYWMQQLAVTGTVILTRAGKRNEYRASLAPEARSLYSRLRRAK